jgi:hypothetical protein
LQKPTRLIRHRLRLKNSICDARILAALTRQQQQANPTGAQKEREEKMSAKMHDKNFKTAATARLLFSKGKSRGPRQNLSVCVCA